MTSQDNLGGAYSSTNDLVDESGGMDQNRKVQMQALLWEDKKQTMEFRQAYGSDVLKISKIWIFFVMLVVVAEMVASAFIGRSAMDAAPLSVLVASPFAMLFIVLKSIFPKTTVSRHESHTEGED